LNVDAAATPGNVRVLATSKAGARGARTIQIT